MTKQEKNYRIDLLVERLSAAVNCVAHGPTTGNSRSLCIPFNPGPDAKVYRLANTVMNIVFNRLLSCAPQEVIEQMLDEVDNAVVCQGVFEMSNKRKELVREAAFGHQAQVINESGSSANSEQPDEPTLS